MAMVKVREQRAFLSLSDRRIRVSVVFALEMLWDLYYCLQEKISET